MIKELWTLVRMLFRTNPKNKEKVSLLGMNHIPVKGYKYLMWCGYMIYRNDMYDRRQKEWATEQFKIDERHEQIHLEQAKACGSWFKYYMKYLWEWLKGNPITNPASSAYKTNPMEIAAYANQDNPEYLEDFHDDSMTRYNIKDRKNVYLEHREVWNEYIKTL